MKPDPSPSKALSRVVGLDVAKASVTLHDPASRRSRTVANTFEALVEALTPFADYELMVCEATGGYERTSLQAALALGLAAHRADALKVKRYIASHGGAAKSDPIDAAWLSRYGQERGAALALWEPVSEGRETLAALVRHRQDLVAARTEAKNRRSSPACQPLAAFLDDQIAFLAGQVQAIERAIAEQLQRDASLAEAARRLRAQPGFGAVAVSSLLALMPELGRMNRRQAASLAGLAPHPRDSGKLSGRRRCGRGRHGLRPVLFMAAMAAIRSCPTLRTFAQRLALAGKSKRLILTAVARKLIVRANSALSLATSQLT
jgi:transposase